MAFFNFFYTSSGTLTLSVGILYQLEAIKVLLVTSLPHAVGMKLILIGSAVSLVMFVSYSVIVYHQVVMVVLHSLCSG